MNRHTRDHKSAVTAHSDRVAQSEPSSRKPQLTISVEPSQWNEIRLPGTTTRLREAADRLAERVGIVDTNRPWVGEGVVGRHTENPVDPDALAVFVHGEMVAYLPSFAQKDVDVDVPEKVTLPIQVWSRTVATGQRTLIWGWLTGDPPRWTYSEDDPAPFTATERNRDSAKQMADSLNSRASESAAGREKVLAGTVDGVHYLQTVDLVAVLQREGNLEEALRYAEVGLRGYLQAWRHEAQQGQQYGTFHYAKRVAIILRKLKRHADEVEVLYWFRDEAAEITGPSSLLVNEVNARLEKILKKHPELRRPSLPPET